MSEWYDYMIRASKHAKDDNELWIRYLYKVIDYRWIRLTDEDYENLMKSEELSSDQKLILKDAMTEGTDLRNRVIRANQKFQARDILSMFERGEYGREKSVRRLKDEH